MTFPVLLLFGAVCMNGIYAAALKAGKICNIFEKSTDKYCIFPKTVI